MDGGGVETVLSLTSGSWPIAGKFPCLFYLAFCNMLSKMGNQSSCRIIFTTFAFAIMSNNCIMRKGKPEFQRELMINLKNGPLSYLSRKS